VRRSLVHPLAAGLALAVGLPAAAVTDLERLEALEHEVAVLKRKLEAQEEEAARQESAAPVVGAGPDGFFLRTADSSFQLRLRAYTQADSRWLAESGDAGDDTFAFRRVRLDFGGTLFQDIDFRIMPDFANGTLTLFDAYVDLRYFPKARLQIGKFKPPLGLERLQSATALMFIERAFPTLLVPSRDLGAMLWGELAGGLLVYQIGVFNGVRDGGTQDIDSDDAKDVVGRLFFHPLRPFGNERLDGLGIGLAGSWGVVDEQMPASFRTTAASTNFFQYRGAATGPPSIQAVTGDGDRARLSPQAYWYVGPFGLLAEYVFSREDMLRGGNHEELTHDAWQVAASFALTGEDASYKGLVPAAPFAPGKGTWGAFELVARYNEIDFDDDSFPLFADPAVSATEARGWTVGLNWFLNRWIKVALDFDRTSFDAGATGGSDRDTETTILTRLQLSY
jgi:phosphate-selective porin OprO/OprP